MEERGSAFFCARLRARQCWCDATIFSQEAIFLATMKVADWRSFSSLPLTFVIVKSSRFCVRLCMLMEKQEAQQRLRRAAGLLTQQPESPTAGASRLLEAWESLKCLRDDDFPAEIRHAFSFLEYEISRAESQELSAREIAFLTEKIQKLEGMWIAMSSADSSA
jgi:hypothetical protein